MNLSLRTLALGTAIMAAGAIFAQDITVTQKWISHEGINAGDNTIRYGNGFGGKIYYANGNDIQTLENGTVETFVTLEFTPNKGFFIDDAGNILVHKGFPLSKANWMNFALIKAADKSVYDITLEAPEENEDWGQDELDIRADGAGRAIGNFFSEEGGLCFLPAAKKDYPLPIWIVAGEEGPEQILCDYATSKHHKDGPGSWSGTYAQPSVESMDDVDEDNFKDLFYFLPKGGMDIMYIDANGNDAYLPKADAGTSYHDGFDVFELGGKRYTVRFQNDNAAETWTSNFIIADEDLNVVYNAGLHTTEYYGAGYIGSGLWARKVNDSKVELYVLYKSGKFAPSYGALYEITLPAPDLYIYGDVTSAGWSESNPDTFTYADGKYTYTVTGKGGGWKMSTAKGVWGEIDRNAWWPVDVNSAEVKIVAPGTYNLETKFCNGRNMTIANGNYTFTVDLEAKTLVIEGEAIYEPEPLFIRGEINDWGESNPLTSDLKIDAAGNCTYTIELESLSGEFAIANSSWSTKFCSGAQIDGLGRYVLEAGDANAKVNGTLKDVLVTVVINKDSATKATVYITKKSRKPFAYGVTLTTGENNNFTVAYTATGASEAAEIELTNKETGEKSTIALPAAVKGANTATFSAADLAEGSYAWALRLAATGDEAAALAYMMPTEYKGAANQYGGPVFIHDVKAASYGYVVLGMSGTSRFVVFNPEGEMQHGGTIHTDVVYNKDTNIGAPNNSNSCIMRGGAHGGYAVFSDWNDAGAGSYYVNPLDATEKPHNIFASEGAICGKGGLWSLNGTDLGGGHVGIAFQGYGADTRAWTFDEDLAPGNCVHMYEIGEAQYITTAPKKTFTEDAGKWASTHGWPVALSKGVMICQHRATAGDANVPSFMYYDRDGELVWESAGNENYVGGEGFCVNADETLCAYNDYNGAIRVCSFGWSDKNEPVIGEPLYTITAHQGAAGTRVAAKFDAANNLHIYDRAGIGYGVYVLPGTTKSYYDSRETLAVVDGLETLKVAEGAVEYFNLQGVRVENPSNGIYIRRQGNSVSKVYVK